MTILSLSSVLLSILFSWWPAFLSDLPSIDTIFIFYFFVVSSMQRI